jgi:hypothetical protein
LLVVMVKEFANTPPGALGDFACSLGGTHAHILARNHRAFSYIAGGVDRVQGDQIARAFSYSLGCCANALGCPFAHIARTAANLAPGAVFLLLGVAFGLFSPGLGLCFRLRLGGLLNLGIWLSRLLCLRLGCSGWLAVLAGGLQPAEG